MRKNGLIEGRTVGRAAHSTCAIRLSAAPGSPLSFSLIIPHAQIQHRKEYLLASLLTPYLFLFISTMTWDGLIKEPFPPRETVDSQRLQ